MAASGSRDNLIAAALVGTVVVVLGYASGIGVRPSQAGDQPVIAMPTALPPAQTSPPQPTTPAEEEEEPDDDGDNTNPSDDSGSNHPGLIVDPGDSDSTKVPITRPSESETPLPTATPTSTLPPPGPTPTKLPTSAPTCPPGIVESVPVVGPVVGPIVQPVLDPLQAALLGESACLLVVP